MRLTLACERLRQSPAHWFGELKTGLGLRVFPPLDTGIDGDGAVVEYHIGWGEASASAA